MDWSDLPVFLAVMREGSALGAARRLGTDQATVGRRLKRLEDALGLTLFERGPRGARPTANARALLADAEGMEAAATALHGRADGLRRNITGTIRLTMSPGVVGHLTEVIRAFRADHPGIRFEIDESEVLRRLEDGEADIAVRAIARPVGDTLVARKLTDHRWAVYASTDYVARRGRPADAGAMSRHDAVLYEGIAPGHLPFLADLQDRVGPGGPDAARATVVGMGAMQSLLAAGQGAGLLPRSTGDADPRLAFCFEEPGMSQPFWMLWSRQAADAPHVAAFLAHCATAVERTLAAMPAEWRA
ncbi:LysR family transcriptional regulator [Jannaschia sp. Os4]|uniref:LysR family transcriptional regulator n=1 Tax=Jannaschia sp. Os4 TaxID=2807617 RepID=UPI00193961D4|nr:LysR family transcriptional regulator [Jannaschia sp. Os4]MBM2576058.1 LysR family transcriptional regulator [Jannaschia sp. Os4]